MLRFVIAARLSYLHRDAVVIVHRYERFIQSGWGASPHKCPRRLRRSRFAGSAVIVSAWFFGMRVIALHRSIVAWHTRYQTHRCGVCSGIIAM
jgi:hypothetical protein